MGPSMNLMKWWAKHGIEKGRVTRHLSPYEISPVRSLINTIPQKTVRKIQENGAILIPSLVLFVGTVKWGVAANDEHHPLSSDAELLDDERDDPEEHERRMQKEASTTASTGGQLQLDAHERERDKDQQEKQKDQRRGESKQTKKEQVSKSRQTDPEQSKRIGHLLQFAIKAPDRKKVNAETGMQATSSSSAAPPAPLSSSSRSNSFLSSTQAMAGPPTSQPARLPSRKSFILQQQQQQQQQASSGARPPLARSDTADANFFSGFRDTNVFDAPRQQGATRMNSSASVSGASAAPHAAALRDRSNSWAVPRSYFPGSEHTMDPKSTGKLKKEISNAVKVVETFLSPKMLKDQSIPEELLIEAYGLVFLTVYKVGFLFSGKIGNGFVISRTASGWSAPSFISSGGLGFGMMAGGEMVNYMIILSSRSAVKVFTRNGQFQLGSELDLAVGPIGRAASASVNLSRGGIAPNYSYSHSVGLYGGIGLTSAVICTRRSLNAKLYGSNVTARQILGGEVPCTLAEPLWKALDRALGVQREYANGLPVLMPSFVGVSCDACGYMNTSENHMCTRCQNLLVYSVSVHSGRRNTSGLIVTTNHAEPQ